MKMLKSGDTLDRLSELPESLILKILSSLEMRDVVRTTLLSKRWNNLWTTVPCLCFTNKVTHNEEEIRNFINQTLLLWKGTKIMKFKIRFWGYFDEKSLYRDMNLWLHIATEKKVEELYLCLPCYDDRIGPLPHCIYECSSIRKLWLDVKCDLHIRGDVHWDVLKSLTIKCFSVTEDVINRLVSSAPQLEIFDLSILYDDTNEKLSIRSCSLRKLSIHKSPYYKQVYDPPMHAVLTIWAPNLETLILSGTPYSNCLLMDVSSLTDVTLHFEDVRDERWGVVLGETLRQILPTFQHVEKLTLSSWCFKVLAVMKGEYSFSPLSNVKLLRLTHQNLIKPDEIVGLLEIFPEVKMLDISVRRMVYSPKHPPEQDTGEPLNSEVNAIKSLMMQLRIVEIGWVKYEKSMFQFIEFFLEHATMLEKIVIQKRGGKNVESDDMILAAEKLLSLQRSFPTVELIFCKER